MASVVAYAASNSMSSVWVKVYMRSRLRLVCADMNLRTVGARWSVSKRQGQWKPMDHFCGRWRQITIAGVKTR